MNSDPARRRKAQRSQREKGCWVYIPAEKLQVAGYAETGLTPYYRVWAARGGSVVVRLYREA